jgi:hypothetical protein
MSKSTRHWAKRKLESAEGNLYNCGEFLDMVKNCYQENHPDIAEAVSINLEAIEAILVSIASIRKSI